MLPPARRIAIHALVLFGACALLADTGVQPVIVKVEIVSPREAKKPVGKTVTTKDVSDASNIVIWLKSLNPASPAAAVPRAGHATPQVAQSNKSFDPHVLVIEAGTPVQFPNKDPFLHNVFSLFEGKRFDLGFYEAGSSKTVHFDRPGVSFLFCNIHPEMSGAVIVVDTPYFGTSDRTGRVTIANVPDGRYELNVWYERSLPEDLKAAGRTVTISDSTRTLEPVRVVENPNFTLEHKNKYGQEYPPATDDHTFYPGVRK